MFSAVQGPRSVCVHVGQGIMVNDGCVVGHKTLLNVNGFYCPVAALLLGLSVSVLWCALTLLEEGGQCVLLTECRNNSFEIITDCYKSVRCIFVCMERQEPLV